MSKELSGVKRNFIYNLFYEGLTVITPLITTPYISRVLRPAGIGEYGFAYAVAHYFVLFAQLGINNYGNRAIAKCRDDKERLSTTFSEIYGMQLLTTSCSVIVYLIYVYFINKNNGAQLLMLFYVISAGVNINWLFYGLEEFKLTVLRNSVIKLLVTASIFIFVKCEDDIYKYCFIMAFGFLLSALALWPFTKKFIRIKKVSVKRVLAHIRPNFALFIPAIAVSIYRIMDKLMLGVMSTKIEVGYYESTEKLVSIPLTLITVFGTVMLPRMSNLVQKEDKNRISEIVNNSLLLAIIAIAPTVAGMMAVTRNIVPIFYGTGYEKCEYLFYILLPSTVFIGMANVLRTQVLIPYNRDKDYIISCIAGAVVNFLLNILLIQFFGAIGAAIATLATEIVVFTYQAIKTKDYAHFGPIAKIILEIALISAIMGVLVFAIPDFSNAVICLIVKIAAGICIFGLLLLICLQFNRNTMLIELVDNVIPPEIRHKLSKIFVNKNTGE